MPRKRQFNSGHITCFQKAQRRWFCRDAPKSDRRALKRRQLAPCPRHSRRERQLLSDFNCAPKSALGCSLYLLRLLRSPTLQLLPLTFDKVCGAFQRFEERQKATRHRYRLRERWRARDLPLMTDATELSVGASMNKKHNQRPTFQLICESSRHEAAEAVWRRAGQASRLRHVAIAQGRPRTARRLASLKRDAIRQVLRLNPKTVHVTVDPHDVRLLSVRWPGHGKLHLPASAVVNAERTETSMAS